MKDWGIVDFYCLIKNFCIELFIMRIDFVYLEKLV